MAYLLKGALIEYGTGLIGPIPNVVIFQFNPESLTRTMKIPPRPDGATSRENTQAGERPLESISFKAEFSAADELKDKNVLAKLFGVGPRLSALEKMVNPSSKIAGLIGAAIDAIGDALGGGGGDPTQAIPREKYPKIRAEVEIELTVNAVDSCSNDKLAQGALDYSNIAKEVMAMANLANTAEQIVELIPL